MELKIQEEQKIIEVWLSRDEESMREQLKPEYEKWKKAGYLTAVYLSGSDDLYRRTSDLLCYNRKRLAELETQKEKPLRDAM